MLQLNYNIIRSDVVVHCPSPPPRNSEHLFSAVEPFRRSDSETYIQYIWRMLFPDASLGIQISPLFASQSWRRVRNFKRTWSILFGIHKVPAFICLFASSRCCLQKTFPSREFEACFGNKEEMSWKVSSAEILPKRALSSNGTFS